MFSYLHQPKGFYKHLFLLALPVIVQNLITTSLGFLDTFMVGLLGSDQMSAVTVANVPVFIIQLVVFGLQSGQACSSANTGAAATARASTASWASAL